MIGLGNLGITALKVVEQIDTTLGELTVHGAERRLEALKDINRQNEALITTVVEFSKKEGLPGIAEKIAYHGTSLVLDTVLIDKAATALNKFAKIANASIAEVAHKVANAATKVPELEAITAEGIAIKVPQPTEICALSEAQQSVKQVGKISEVISNEVNQTSTAILKNGYYEVNGFKFTKKYYEKLWNAGRRAPSLTAKEILDHATIIIPDHLPGFFRYEFNNWELVFNPETREIWHICKK